MKKKSSMKQSTSRSIQTYKFRTEGDQNIQIGVDDENMKAFIRRHSYMQPELEYLNSLKTTQDQFGSLESYLHNL